MRPLLAGTSLAICLATPVIADGLRIVTDIRITQALVEEVLGEQGEATALAGAGMDPHRFQLRPSQARDLENANLLIWVGPALTPWLERIAGEQPSITLLDLPGLHLREIGEHEDAHHDEDHDAGHGHDEAEAHEMEDGHSEHNHDEDHAAEEAHDHSGVDPHAWLNPGNVSIWLAEIASAMGELDPDNAYGYAERAEAAATRIAATTATLSANLEAADKRIIVFHDAYGYFEEAFPVSVAGSIALSDATKPGAGHLRRLMDTAEAEGVTCIFREPEHSPDLAVRIAEDTGMQLGMLDPLGTLLPDGPKFYDRLLTAMADALVGCDETN